jgi:hypothetical protein
MSAGFGISGCVKAVGRAVGTAAMVGATVGRAASGFADEDVDELEELDELLHAAADTARSETSGTERSARTRVSDRGGRF